MRSSKRIGDADTGLSHTQAPIGAELNGAHQNGVTNISNGQHLALNGVTNGSNRQSLALRSVIDDGHENHLALNGTTSGSNGQPLALNGVTNVRNANPPVLNGVTKVNHDKPLALNGVTNVTNDKPLALNRGTKVNNGSDCACNRNTSKPTSNGVTKQFINEIIAKGNERNDVQIDEPTESEILSLSEEPDSRAEGTYKISRDSNFHFLEDLFELMIKDGLIEATDRKNKVCEFKHPEELRALLTDLDIEAKPASTARLLDVCKDIIKYSVKTAHPRFFNQLYGGLDQYSLGGAWLTETLNASQYTYEVSPVFTLMEKDVINKMLNLIGFTGGDGIFTPGGSMANLYALNVARYAKHPETKTGGLMCLEKPLRLFTSEKCHYSLTKAAFTLGFGTDCVTGVATDSEGRMEPSALEENIQQAIAEGFEPFFVNATAGTTVLGAYDPLVEVAEICQKYKLWMHVDGAWGGGAILTSKYKHLLKGVEMADSMTWNPHKLMGAPQQCATFLCKHKGVLQACHSANASYLFQQDKHYDTSYDTGDMSLQCGRKVDVLKLWMQWKGKGDLGLARDVEHLFDLSRYLAKKVKETEGFRLLKEPECTNVCFWYIPPSLRGQEETEEWWQQLGQVAPQIKARLMERGSLMTGYQPDGNYVNFFRMILSNFDSTEEDMDFVVQEIDTCGVDL